ncbi:MAG TPA: hypothetical protein PKA63_05555 [Oligoflexia bacterium]|nr:hypothetical protein [Oligoflexia bacterium]HMP48115.1 hypothetical protein [Oligoflexia bacterium]
MAKFSNKKKGSLRVLFLSITAMVILVFLAYFFLKERSDQQNKMTRRKEERNNKVETSQATKPFGIVKVFVTPEITITPKVENLSDSEIAILTHLLSITSIVRPEIKDDLLQQLFIKTPPEILAQVGPGSVSFEKNALYFHPLMLQDDVFGASAVDHEFFHLTNDKDAPKPTYRDLCIREARAHAYSVNFYQKLFACIERKEILLITPLEINGVKMNGMDAIHTRYVEKILLAEQFALYADYIKLCDNLPENSKFAESITQVLMRSDLLMSPHSGIPKILHKIFLEIRMANIDAPKDLIELISVRHLRVAEVEQKTSKMLENFRSQQ